MTCPLHQRYITDATKTPHANCLFQRRRVPAGDTCLHVTPGGDRMAEERFPTPVRVHTDFIQHPSMDTRTQSTSSILTYARFGFFSILLPKPLVHESDVSCLRSRLGAKPLSVTTWIPSLSWMAGANCHHVSPPLVTRVAD